MTDKKDFPPEAFSNSGPASGGPVNWQDERATPDERVERIRSLRGYFQEIRSLNIEKGWRVDATGIRSGYEFPAYIALLHSEASEALEACRIGQWSDTRQDGKPLGVGPELADVFIRLIDMCDIWGIDLASEVERVLKYGWTRPYQHGGKAL